MAYLFEPPIPAHWQGVSLTPNNSKLSEGTTSSTTTTTLIGRGVELEAIESFLREPQWAPSKSFLFVVGEAGVGKSALMEEIRTRCQRSGSVQVLFAECHQTEHAPYFPLVKSLAEFLTSNDSAAARSRLQSVVSQTFGDALAMIPGLGRAAGVVDKIRGIRATSYVPEFAPYQGKTVLAFADFLRRFSDRKPVVLMLDDLQWADEDTIGLLSYVSESVNSRNLRVISTLRAESLGEAEPDSPVRTLVLSLIRTERGARLDLPRLKREDLASLVERFQGPHTLADTDLDTLFRETEGNPFFLRESLYLLLLQGLLVRERAGLRSVGNLSGGLVPQTVRDTIRARIQRLPIELRRPLDAASVVGSVFDSETVSKMIETSRFHTLERLRDLETIYSLVQRINGYHKFYHIKLRETIYQDLPLDLRSQYHLAVAEYLSGKGSIESLEVAADHFIEAGERLRASQLLGLVGETAVRDENFQGADRALSKWLEVAEVQRVGESAGRAEIRYLRAKARYHLGRYQESFEDALLAERDVACPDTLKAQATHLQGRSCYFLNRQKECVEAYSRSLAQSRRLEDWRLEFVNHLSLAAIHDLSGAYSEMESEYFAAERLALDRQDREAVADVHLRYGMIIMDEPPRVIPRIKEALRLYTELGNSRGVAAAHLNLGNEYFFQKEMDDAQQHYKESLRVLEESDGVERCYPLNNLSLVFQMEGRLDSAKATLDQALACYLTSYHRTFILNNIANTLLLIGSPDEASHLLESVLPDATADCDPFTRELTYYNLGMAHLAAGRAEAATEWIEKSFSNRTKSNAALNRGKRCRALARAWTARGNKQQAEFWALKAEELLRTDVPDRWYYADLDYEAADLAFYE